MRLVQARIVTDDVAGLAAFYAGLLRADVALNDYYVEVPAGPASVGFSKRRFTEYRTGCGAGQGAREVILDFQAGDADAEYPRIAAFGVDWIMPPATQPWGSRSMVFRDPEGTLVNVFSRKELPMASEAARTAPAGTLPGAAVPAPSPHLGLALVVISMAQLMLVLDELIVNTALPHIQGALHFSGTGLEWVVTGYAVTFGGLLMLGGRSGDILGRRRVLRDGILLFTIASLLGGLATQSWMLIGARVLQGAGAALAAPAALSLITVTFPEGRHRTRALGVYAAMTGIGGGVGLVVGGLLTTYASWRWVFFVNVPIGAALAFGVRYVLPESQRHPRSWDLPGAVTGTAGFALLIYGLTRGATGPDGVNHWGDAATVVALAAAAALLAAFGVIEARSAQPLLPLWIFTNRNRTGVYLILLCLASTFFGMFFFLTLFTQVVWGYSALRGGLAYLPFVGGFIVVAGICSQLLIPRFGSRVPMTIGAILAPVSMFWLSRVHEHSHYLTGICLPLLVFAGTAGLIFVPLTMILVEGISDEHAGIASSMFNAGQQVGGAVGLAVIGSVAWTIVSNHVRNQGGAGPGSPVFGHALSAGVTAALTMGAAATLAALAVTLLAIRTRG